MRRFTTESIFEAVDWYYADVDTEEDFHKEESKPNLDETYKLEAKDDEEQSKLILAVEEAKREAKIEVLRELRKQYVNLHDKIVAATDTTDFDAGIMMAYNMCISDIEKILKDLE